MQWRDEQPPTRGDASAPAGGDAAGGDVIGGEAIGGPLGAAKWVQEWMSHAPVQEQQLAAADADALHERRARQQMIGAADREAGQRRLRGGA